MEKYLKLFNDKLKGAYSNNVISTLAEFCHDLDEDLGNLEVYVSNDGICEIKCWSIIIDNDNQAFLDLCEVIKRIRVRTDGKYVFMRLEF